MPPTPTPLSPHRHRSGVRHDARGCPLTGANAAALGAFEQALASLLAWRGGTDEPLARAVDEAPGFVMAHALQAWLLALGRDPQRVRRAQGALARARQCGAANEREGLHLAAIAAVLADDHLGAKARLGQLLQQWPRDVLALHTAHSLDYLSGDVDELAARVARARPAWEGVALPGRHAVLSMHAFGLAERGELEAAEAAARAALVLNPLDARAHHAMAHIFETRGRAADGIRWLERHADAWATSGVVATHCSWHLALFHLALGDAGAALALYDRRIAAGAAGDIADLIDAAALLWRVQLAGGDAGGRWQTLADAWAPHIDDHFCSFSDVHAMLAFVGARDALRSRRLLQQLQDAQSRPTRHGLTTRQLGLPACRALVAFGHGNHPLAITLLAGLPATAHRLGGSHAQRDVLHLTLLQAVERIRRPLARGVAVSA